MRGLVSFQGVLAADTEGRFPRSGRYLTSALNARPRASKSAN